MTPLRQTIVLFRPSLLSGITCSIVTLIVIAVIAWSHITNEGFFYDFLFGRYGVATALLFVPNSAVAIGQSIVNSSITYYLIMGACAVMVGFLAYALLQGVGRIRQEAVVITEEMINHDPHLKNVVYSDLYRLGVRLAGIMGWLVYVLVFVHMIWPFIVLLVRAGLVAINTGQGSGWWYIGAATILLAISLHQHIVFGRLCMLRLRLFGDYTSAT